MMYVGVDVGKSKCRAAMMSQEGKITEEFDFKNERARRADTAKKPEPTATRGIAHRYPKSKNKNHF